MKWFTNLSIKMKLGLSFTAMLLIVAVLGLISLQAISQLNDMIVNMQSTLLPRVKYTMTMSREMTAFRASEFQHILSPEKTQKSTLEDRMKANYTKHELMHDKLKPLIQKGAIEAKKILMDVEAADYKYWGPHYEAMRLSSKNDIYAARDVLIQGPGLADFERANEQLSALADLAMSHSEEAVAQATKLNKAVRMLIICVFAIALCIGIVLAFYITSLLSNPINKLINGAHKIAQGNLTVYIPQDSRDEVGDLAAAFNHMTQGLQQVIGQVSDTSSSLSAEAEQLNTAANNILMAAEKAVFQSTIAATASEEMAATSAEISQSCQMAAASANQANDSAEENAVIVKESLNIMGRVSNIVQEASATVEQLGARSDQIGAIVETIEGIANQANLLALHAADEAARVGNQGHACSGVAIEIRSLAEQTTVATSKIIETIRIIQQETREAVVLMKEGAAEAGRGTAGTGRSGMALDNILQQIGFVTIQVKQIAMAATELTTTTRQISKNAHSISICSKEGIHGVQATLDSVNQLSVHAGTLNTIVKQFNLTE
ncbi:MAG: methyl-accepting chemotaxis protein [Geobacteraceae bacterium]|nr:methyl-accepting chemotaxis protein [Geobacteraceae bacterium]NTW80747.1 methyl-accepting chemotaxis protein [Geobacteraceae bacterium]